MKWTEDSKWRDAGSASGRQAFNAQLRGLQRTQGPTLWDELSRGFVVQSATRRAPSNINPAVPCRQPDHGKSRIYPRSPPRQSRAVGDINFILYRTTIYCVKTIGAR